jgi:hypothetical protein
MFSKGKKQPAYERLCCIADDLGMRIGIAIGEMVPCGWNQSGEANSWRHPLTKLIAFQGLSPKAEVDVAQPDSDTHFIKACARLSGILGLHRAA